MDWEQEHRIESDCGNFQKAIVQGMIQAIKSCQPLMP